MGPISFLSVLYKSPTTQDSDYIKISGFIGQAQVDIAPADEGDQLDPHGPDAVGAAADALRFHLELTVFGNPLGALMYSDAFPSNVDNNNTFQLVIGWVKYVSNVHKFRILNRSYMVTASWGATGFASRSAIPQRPRRTSSLTTIA